MSVLENHVYLIRTLRRLACFQKLVLFLGQIIDAPKLLKLLPLRFYIQFLYFQAA